MTTGKEIALWVVATLFAVTLGLLITLYQSGKQADLAWESRYKEAVDTSNFNLEAANHFKAEVSKLETQAALTAQTTNQVEQELEMLKNSIPMNPKVPFYQGIYTVCRLIVKQTGEACDALITNMVQNQMYENVEPNLEKAGFNWGKYNGEQVQ